MSRIHLGRRRAPKSVNVKPTSVKPPNVKPVHLSIAQRDALIIRRLADRGAFTSEIDTYQATTKRRPGTLGKANAAVLIGGGIAGLGASVPLLWFMGPLAGGGVAAAGFAITLGITSLMPRGVPRPASMRRHIFADVGVVNTREESAQLTKQLASPALHLITSGKERFVLPGWDAKRIALAKIDGKPVTQAQRHAIKVVLKQTEAQQQILKTGLANNRKKLKKDFKHFWHFATLTRDYNTVIQTWFMNYKLKRVAKKDQKARQLKA